MVGGLRLHGSTPLAGNTVLDMGVAAGGVGNNTWIQATDATDLSQRYHLTLNPLGGNVGIGTSTPGAALHVTGNAIVGAATSGNVALAVHGPNSPTGQASSQDIRFAFDGAGSAGVRSWRGASWDTYLQFVTTSPNQGADAPTPRMTIDANGRVGIGTEVPSSTLHVIGDFTATGAKCRAVEGTEYGTLYYNAIESATALFSIQGESRMTSGMCIIELDPKWLAGVTIDDKHPMQVWITFYGPHGEYYVERGLDGFTVHESTASHATFGWKVEARQRGYEDVYLNRIEQCATR
jgi:hypothetical protein